MTTQDRTAARRKAEWDYRWRLLWRMQVSALYHQKRERFLDGIDRAGKAVGALGGAAAFAQIRNDPDMGMWIAAVIAVVSTLSLVYGPSAKARRHGELARDFKRLESELVACGSAVERSVLAKFDSRISSLESSEPASLGALVTQCHNELATMHGHLSLVTPLPLLQRLFKNWFDFDQSNPADPGKSEAAAASR